MPGIEIDADIVENQGQGGRVSRTRAHGSKKAVFDGYKPGAAPALYEPSAPRNRALSPDADKVAPPRPAGAEIPAGQSGDAPNSALPQEPQRIREQPSPGGLRHITGQNPPTDRTDPLKLISGATALRILIQRTNGAVVTKTVSRLRILKSRARNIPSGSTRFRI